MSIFVSTSCLSSIYSYPEILDIYHHLCLDSVELGILSDPHIDIKKLIKKYNFNYTVHHYFPPPRKPFIINLASQDKNILKKSVRQILSSIDFCSKFDIDLFSFHSGFRVDPDMYLRFSQKNIPPYEISFNTFKDSLVTIVDYAEEKNVKIAIENNVLSEYNLIKGQNKFLLMCEVSEFERLFKEILSHKLGVLLDLGHLKVTSNSLGFDKDTFIKKLQSNIYAVHVHENHGRVDEHNCPNKDSWSIEILVKYFNKKKLPIILECKCNKINNLETSLAILGNIIKN